MKAEGKPKLKTKNRSESMITREAGEKGRAENLQRVYEAKEKKGARIHCGRADACLYVWVCEGGSVHVQ